MNVVPDDESGAPRLTPKQESFVAHLMEGKSAKEAYICAYGKGNQKDSSLTVAGSKLKADPKIQRAIRLRQRIACDESDVTRQSHLAELARGREIAFELGQASAAIQAEHYRGRVAGLYNDKLTIGVGPSDEALLSQIAALLGPDMARVLGESMGVDRGQVIDLEPSQDSDLLRLSPPLEE